MKGRYAKIAGSIAARELLRLAAERPSDLFKSVFYDVREKAKKLKDKWEQEAAAFIEKTFRADLKEKGVKVKSLKISLGKYRGSRFVTSAKLTAGVKDEETANRLLTYLQKKFSPKFQLKGWNGEQRQALYNVR